MASGTRIRYVSTMAYVSSERSKTPAGLSEAEDTIARLDERIATSPIQAGWIARGHFADACASLWLEGELVPLEDLVLHDAAANATPPTHELARAHLILRARRRIVAAPAGWAMQPAAIDMLMGRPARVETPILVLPPIVPDAIDEEETALDAELAALDALIARTSTILAGRPLARSPALDAATSVTAASNRATSNRASDTTVSDIAVSDVTVSDAAVSDAAVSPVMPAVREISDDLDTKKVGGESARYERADTSLVGNRFAAWQATVQSQTTSQVMSPVLAAAHALLEWQEHKPFENGDWLGRLLAADLLRARRKTRVHLTCLSIGLKETPRRYRQALDRTTRLNAIMEALTLAAQTGLRDHDRWLAASRVLDTKLRGRRSNSHLPQVIAMVMARPMITTTMVAHELKITPRSAQDLIAQLGLRELTGRKRYRAWGVL